MKANKDESASRTEVTVLCRLRHGSAISSFCCILSVRSKSEASPHSKEGITQGHEYQKAEIIEQILESLPQCSVEREKRRSWVKRQYYQLVKHGRVQVTDWTRLSALTR